LEADKVEQVRIHTEAGSSIFVSLIGLAWPILQCRLDALLKYVHIVWWDVAEHCVRWPIEEFAFAEFEELVEWRQAVPSDVEVVV
jgi:hypothetical protein